MSRYEWRGRDHDLSALRKPNAEGYQASRGQPTPSSCSKAAFAPQHVSFFAVKSRKRDQNPWGASVLLGLAANRVFVLLTIALAGTEPWEKGWAVAAVLRWNGVRVGDAEEVCHIQSRCCGLKTASQGSGVLPVAAHRVLLFHEHPNAVPRLFAAPVSCTRRY